MSLAPELPEECVSSEVATALLYEFGIQEADISNQHTTILQLLSAPSFYEVATNNDSLPEYAFQTTPLTKQLGYAENTREDVRPVIKLFCEHGILQECNNPKNSPNKHYYLTENARKHLSSDDLADSIELPPSLDDIRDTVTLPYHDPEITLSIGEHTRLLYVALNTLIPELFSDPELLHHDLDDNERARVEHGQLPIEIPSYDGVVEFPVFPDAIIYDHQLDCVGIIEAVSTGGPITNRRKQRIQTTLKEHGIGGENVFFLTVFPDTATFKQHVLDLGDETWYWIKTRSKELVSIGSKDIGEVSVGDVLC